MAAVKTRTIDPWKAKRWYPIMGPRYMNGAFIGETPASEKEKIIGREVKISLAAVTGEIKKQNINITFRITGFEGSNALTDVRRFEISSAYIKRQLRKGRDRIDDVFVLKTSDGMKVVLKPFLVTKNKVNNSKKTLLRKMAKQELREYVSKIAYSQLVQELLSQKLQKTLSQAMRKICPLRNSDIRVMQLSESESEIPAAREGPVEEKSESAEEKPASVKAKAKKKPAKEAGEKPAKKAAKQKEKNTEKAADEENAQEESS